VKAKEADVNLRCIPGAKADEPRRSGLLLEYCHAYLNSVGASVSQPHWPTPALWNFKEYFLDCLLTKNMDLCRIQGSTLPFIRMNARMG
jgi:hypothetical protein